MFAERLAPADLDAAPFYVLYAHEVGSAVGDCRTYGLWGRSLDLLFRHVIAGRIGWQGRGPCIVLDPLAIWLDALADLLASDGESIDPDWYERRLAGILLHELAHEVEGEVARPADTQSTTAAVAKARSA